MSKRTGVKKRTRKVKAAGKVKPGDFKVIRPDVAGIDLGAYEHWVAGPPNEDGKPNVAVFTTTTPQLHALVDWLREQGIKSVAMHSTGVYWIPLYEVLEARGLEVLLCDARQTSRVPGRKTDMNECQWMQKLHSCGLLQGAFRPPEEICKLRTLVREKSNAMDCRSDWIRSMQKSLDQMNVAVHHAVSDITGKTGMAIIRAIVRGERDPHVLAQFRDPRCAKSKEAIAEHLTGHWREDHLFSLTAALSMYDAADQTVHRYEEEILSYIRRMENKDAASQRVPPPANKAKARNLAKRGQEPMREALFKMTGVDLTSIPGIGVDTVETFISEIGTDLTRFPTEKQFVSFVTLAPKHAMSGGKRVRGRGKSMTASRTAAALRMAALTLRNSPTALGAYYRRIAYRKGASVAVFATARKLATLIYRMLRYGQDYVDIGAEAYEATFQRRKLNSLRQNAKQLGYKLIPLAEETNEA